MNLLIILLAVILTAALALAAELLRTNRSNEVRSYSALWADVSAHRDYQPLERLFDQSDFALVAARPTIAQRLRKSRRQALRLFLRGVRVDFLNAWALCRILSPISPDSGLALRLARHWLVFHSTYAAATLHATLGLSAPAIGEPGELVGAVRALQAGAAELIQAQQRMDVSASAA